MFDNFVFYGSWRETLEGMADDFGADYAKEALWNIMTAATAGDITTEKKFIISFINGAVMPNINKAKDRYAAAVENGKKGGRTPINLKEDEVMEKKKELKTWKAVAEHFEVTEQCLRNKRKEWEKQKNQKNLDIDIDIEKDIDIENDIENESFATLGKTTEPKDNELDEYDEIYTGTEVYTNLPPELMRKVILEDAAKNAGIFGQM